MRRNYLASIVPVIVNAVLNEHQVIVDIVAFVAKGDFPRSRLGEKQRGKILASWVTRKMETIAQFSIRDADGADSQITEVAEPRSAVGSVRVGSSLKNVETVVDMPSHLQDYNSLPAGVSEMPVSYESSIVESPPLPREDEQGGLPIEAKANPYTVHDELHMPQAGQEYYENDYSQRTGAELQHYDFDDLRTPRDVDNPSSLPAFTSSTSTPSDATYNSKPSLSLPSFNEEQSFARDNALWTLPSQRPRQQQQPLPHGVGKTGRSRENSNATEGGDWPQEALIHMNLGDEGRVYDHYDGYGNAL